MAIASLKDLYFDERRPVRRRDADDPDAAAPRRSRAGAELREALKSTATSRACTSSVSELIFTTGAETPPSTPCAGLAGIVQEADDAAESGGDRRCARDAAIIGVAQRIRDTTRLRPMAVLAPMPAGSTGSTKRRLLQETLDEEARTDHRLSEIAEAHINDDARSEADLHADAPVGRLRYVPMDVIAQGRKDRTPLPVRNDDEDLGTARRPRRRGTTWARRATRSSTPGAC